VLREHAKYPSKEAEGEDYVDLGAATLDFYSSLVDLLAKCAPDRLAIQAGKGDSLRARAILRSLISMEDLQRILALRFKIPNFSTQQQEGWLPTRRNTLTAANRKKSAVPNTACHPPNTHHSALTPAPSMRRRRKYSHAMEKSVLDATNTFARIVSLASAGRQDSTSSSNGYKTAQSSPTREVMSRSLGPKRVRNKALHAVKSECAY